MYSLFIYILFFTSFTLSLICTVDSKAKNKRKHTFLVQNRFSLNRPSGPIQSVSQFVRLSVRLSVCLSVCVFTFEVPFKRLFAPTSRCGCPIFLEIRNPLGKVMERSGLIFEKFCLKIVKNCRSKKSFFLLILRVITDLSR